MGHKVGTSLGHIARLCMASVAIVLGLSSPGLGQALGPLFGIDEQENARPARIRLLPDDFFNSFPTAQANNIAVEADAFIFYAYANHVTTRVYIQVSYNGYLATADSIIYDRETGDLTLVGNAVVRDPEQVVYTGTRIEVSGDFKRAYVAALEMQTPNGALITADEVTFRTDAETILTNGGYAPCGFCIDAKGRKIGWSVSATKLVQNDEEKTLYLERPQLELLGVPVASIPYITLYDINNQRAEGFRRPEFDEGKVFGYRLGFPYFKPLGDDTDLWLTPLFMTTQYFMLDSELIHRFDTGSTSLRAAGLYQFDRTVVAGEVGDRDWRGAIQTSGQFVPTQDWVAGWSYLAFTDPAFIGNYALTGFDSTDDIYAQYLGSNGFFDARLQEFRILGNVTQATQHKQGRTLPLLQFSKTQTLDDEWGQIALEGRFIGVNRELDATNTINGVPYTYGYQGNKFHGSVEALWSKQMIIPGGLVVTPYLGARLDGAGFDGGSPLNSTASAMFSVTPIAALDVRFPVLGTDGNSSHLFEPIAQLVYRGSSNTLPGITNDNAHGFIFEDSNLFSFNRFSGTDRQETGLRANIGGQYMANFEDGSWLRLIGGQSFQLAGVNSFSIFDHGQVGNLSGLENASSYLVGGAQMSFGPGVDLGAKIEYDPATNSVVRGAVAVEAAVYDFTLSSDYFYLAAKPARGSLSDIHTFNAALGYTFDDYWTVSTSINWNLVLNDWTSASLGLNYDDKYLAYGAKYTATHNTSNSTIEHGFSVTYALRGLTDL